MLDAKETFLVLLVVGTLALIFVMKDPLCFSCEGLKGIPHEGLKGIPHEGLKGIPHEGLKGIPHEGLRGVPHEGLRGVPDGFAGLPRGLSNFNKDHLNTVNGLTGMPYDNFAGDLKESNMVWKSKNNSADAWDKFDSSPTKYLETSDIAHKCALVSNNYQDAIKCMSLEPDVGDSHSAWISNIQGKTTTASKETVRDDPNDINPWVGLRRPKYQTRAQPLAEARTIASDIPSEMLDYSGSYTI
jgi:hypothetical protein